MSFVGIHKINLYTKKLVQIPEHNSECMRTVDNETGSISLVSIRPFELKRGLYSFIMYEALEDTSTLVSPGLLYMGKSKSTFVISDSTCQQVKSYPPSINKERYSGKVEFRLTKSTGSRPGFLFLEIKIHAPEVPPIEN